MKTQKNNKKNITKNTKKYNNKTNINKKTSPKNISKIKEVLTNINNYLKKIIKKTKDIIVDKNKEITKIKIYRKKTTTGIIYTQEKTKEKKKTHVIGLPIKIKEQNIPYFNYKQIDIKNIINNIGIVLKKLIKNIKKVIYKIINFLKRKVISLKEYLNKRKELKQEKKKIKQEENKLKQEEAKIVETPKEIEEDNDDEYEGYSIKKIIIFILIILLIGFGIYYGIKTHNYNEQNKTSVIKVTKDKKEFNINDNILFDGVIYKITDIELSEGTKFKKPKQGNHFIIVNIEYTNNSDEQKEYSYKNWKMEDEQKEESNRIFTPINVDTALYTGKLVIGSTKRGSLVFEEPIDNKNLKLNFYDNKKLEKLENKEEKPKPNFYINIKIEE